MILLRQIAAVLLAARCASAAGTTAEDRPNPASRGAIPVLSVSLVAEPPAASVGQPVTIMLSIANLGSVTVTVVSSELAFSPSASAAVVARPDSSVKPSLLPGEDVGTGWGIVATSPGTIVFTATVTGTWDSGGRTMAGRATAVAAVRVLTPPRLELGWSGPRAGWCAGAPFRVTLSVANQGEAAAVLPGPPALIMDGPAGAAMVAAPLPGGARVDGGSQVRFTWTLEGLRGGVLGASATVTGADAGSLVPVAAASATAWELSVPGGASMALAVPAEVSRGQWMTVVLTVTNTGGRALVDLDPSLAAPAGAGWARSLPVPDPSRAILPGSSRRFVWSWSVTGLGTLPFTSGLKCRTCDGLVAVSASASATTCAERPAALEAGMAVSATELVSGQKVRLFLAVTNTGGAAATRVTVLAPTPSTSRAALVSGPLRAVLESLPAGSATRLSWEWTLSGQGPVGFTSRVGGHDANARWGLSTGVLDAPAVRVLSPASLKIDRFALFPSPSVVSNMFLTASLVITNKGETPAQLTELTVKEKKAPGAVLGSRSMYSPLLPVDLPAGDSQSIVWTYRTGVWGTATVSAAAKAVEPATGRKLPALEAVSNRITVTAWTAPRGLE